jgi:hypothetical protein
VERSESLELVFEYHRAIFSEKCQQNDKDFVDYISSKLVEVEAIGDWPAKLIELPEFGDTHPTPHTIEETIPQGKKR